MVSWMCVIQKQYILTKRQTKTRTVSFHEISVISNINDYQPEEMDDYPLISIINCCEWTQRGKTDLLRRLIEISKASVQVNLEVKKTWKFQNSKQIYACVGSWLQEQNVNDKDAD